MTGPAARRNFDPTFNGIAAKRYVLTDAVLACGEDVHDDTRYAARVRRLRELANASVERHWTRWVELRDGYDVKDKAGSAVGERRPGFWTRADGKKIEPGDRVPKEAYAGMEGALVQILELDGIYWIQKRETSRMKGTYRDALAKSRYGGTEPDDDDDEDTE